MRTVSEIAAEIRKEWKSVWFGAVPYLDAMSVLKTVDDYYGYDSGREIITYFLANAQTWRGDAARRIKAELKQMIK
jgi:hypothetical protein